MSEQRLLFRFGPIERRGLFGAISGWQALTCAVGAGAGLALLSAASSTAATLAALLVPAVAAAAALGPLHGRTAPEWLAVRVSFQARHGRRGAGSHRARVRGSAAAPRRPRALAGVCIEQLAGERGPIGVLTEAGGKRMTVALACRARGFTLLDPDAQERRLRAWAHVLSGAEGGAVRRLQWIERTVPSAGDELVQWLHHEGDPEYARRGTPLVESYLELISGGVRAAQEHEIVIALQLDARRSRGLARRALGELVADEAARLARLLAGAEIDVLGALSPGQLGRALRLAFDPFARAELTELDAAGIPAGELPPGHAWPLAIEESWDHLRIDGALHSTFWISSWPRRDVSAMFIEAMLGGAGTVRAVAACFEPLPPIRSTREAEAAITRDRADRELRARLGQTETARRRQAQEAALRREQELAMGHGEVRFSGFATVSGRDSEELRAGCAELLERASRARLELRRMYGQQLEAFTFTLPLCRGLR